MSINILSKAIQDLGLNEFEGILYSHLVLDGKINITAIAKKLNTNRVKIYDGLKNLEKLELYVKDVDTKKYFIRPPSFILAKLRHKRLEDDILINELAESLPTLSDRYYKTNKQSSVNTYEGKNRFVKLVIEIIDELKPEEELLWLAEGQEYYEIIDGQYFLSEISSRRKNKKCPAKILALDNNHLLRKAKASDKPDEIREIRFLPPNIKTKGTFTVIGNKIINWNTLLSKAIVIDDKVLANTLREIFYLLREMTPEN